jgi:hypothetical protein
MENNGTVSILTEAEKFAQAEWCFQFFDNEPVVFAWSQDESDPGELVLTLNPTSDSNIVFTDKSMTFKLFSRPMSDETRKLRYEAKDKNVTE